MGRRKVDWNLPLSPSPPSVPSCQREQSKSRATLRGEARTSAFSQCASNSGRSMRKEKRQLPAVSYLSLSECPVCLKSHGQCPKRARADSEERRGNGVACAGCVGGTLRSPFSLHGCDARFIPNMQRHGKSRTGNSSSQERNDSAGQNCPGRHRSARLGSLFFGGR